MQRSPQVAEVLPLLYLRGLSTGDFREALPVLLGEDAAGLSATNIARLTGTWDTEYQAFRRRDLSENDFVYVWVDGIHFNILVEDDRLCTLVVLGVRADGTKELVALEDGYRESAESWASVLRDLSRRGLRAPVVAIGDGALGFWAAVRDVWPETTPQRDWCHRMANVLDKFPKRLRPRAKRALREFMYAATKTDAETAIGAFVVAAGSHDVHFHATMTDRVSSLDETFASLQADRDARRFDGPKFEDAVLRHARVVPTWEIVECWRYLEWPERTTVGVPLPSARRQHRPRGRQA